MKINFLSTIFLDLIPGIAIDTIFEILQFIRAVKLP